MSVGHTLFAVTSQAQNIIEPENLNNSDSTKNRKSYKETIVDIQQKRIALFERYRIVRSDSARSRILHEAGEQLVQFVANDIAPFWYDTPWDFNGTTQIPGTGMIACGYFVTTVLRDVGVVLDRIKLAQQPSETIIKQLVGSDAIKRFRNIPIEKFVAAIREWGEGLYVVGLDCHVGFIVFDDMGVRFIHSSYLEPLCVVREDAIESTILKSSRYRVLGKLTSDHHFLLAWLKGVSVDKVNDM